MASVGGGSCGTIKLFKFFQKSCQNIGIHPPESNRNRSPINWKNWLILFCHAEFYTSSAAFLLFEENWMIEYGIIFYTCTSGLLASVLYLLMIFEVKNISTFIKNCERFVEKSEYIYRFIDLKNRDETNEIFDF